MDKQLFDNDDEKNSKNFLNFRKIYDLVCQGFFVRFFQLSCLSIFGKKFWKPPTESWRAHLFVCGRVRKTPPQGAHCI